MWDLLLVFQVVIKGTGNDESQVYCPRHFKDGKRAKPTVDRCNGTLGGDPAQMWCSSAPLPPGIDEYLLAAWLRLWVAPWVMPWVGPELAGYAAVGLIFAVSALASTPLLAALRVRTARPRLSGREIAFCGPVQQGGQLRLCLRHLGLR